MDLSSCRAGVMGLGVSGEAAARFLLARGAEVVAVDARQESDMGPVVEQLREAGATVRTGGDGPGVFDGCDLVVISPGVPPEAAPVASARERGAEVVSEIELAGRFLKGRIAGITGSNGKSTVTAMTSAILSASGLKARPCGNIGLPLISMADEEPRTLHVKDLDREEQTGGDAPEVIYVTEISSFQLEATSRFRPEVAALLNLSPDHLDRYASAEDYYAAKARIFANQAPEDTAVINADDPLTWALAAGLRARLVSFSLGSGGGEGIRIRDGHLVHVRGGRETWLMSASEVRLPGRHNLENVAASAAIALALGADPAAVGRAVIPFPPLPHRLRLAGKIGGVAFYDDSKATNTGAARRAVESFDAPVVLMLGGLDKGGDFEGLIGAVGGRLRAVVTFGAAGDSIAAQIGRAPVEPVEVVRGGSLEEAVPLALDRARPGDVVLLAPGCASFDAYAGYAARGDAFTAEVRRLAEASEGA